MMFYETCDPHFDIADQVGSESLKKASVYWRCPWMGRTQHPAFWSDVPSFTRIVMVKGDAQDEVRPRYALLDRSIYKATEKLRAQIGKILDDHCGLEVTTLRTGDAEDLIPVRRKLEDQLNKFNKCAEEWNRIARSLGGEMAFNELRDAHSKGWMTPESTYEFQSRVFGVREANRARSAPLSIHMHEHAAAAIESGYINPTNWQP